MSTSQSIFEVIISPEIIFLESRRTVSDIYLRTFYLGNSVLGGTSCWGRLFWIQALEADQHILQSLKIVFLSKNLDQNMPKTFYFGKRL